MPKSTNINRAALTYVALRPLRVGNSIRQPGDAVPEAATWRNVHNYISSGFLVVTGGPHAHPGVINTPVAKHSQVTKAQGQKPYTHHRPVDHNGTPTSVPVDEL